MSVHLALSLRFKLQTALLVWDAWVSVTSILATLHQAHTWLLALRSTERSAVTCPAALPAESGGPTADAQTAECACGQPPRLPERSLQTFRRHGDSEGEVGPQR